MAQRPLDRHEQAMEAADAADAALRDKDFSRARALLREACRLETEAAMQLHDQRQAEPSRSVLFRSAASLAVQSGQWGAAAMLIAEGLSGDPPPEIRQELKDLLSSVHLPSLGSMHSSGGDAAFVVVRRLQADFRRTLCAESPIRSRGEETAWVLCIEAIRSAESELHARMQTSDVHISLYSPEEGLLGPLEHMIPADTDPLRRFIGELAASPRVLSHVMGRGESIVLERSLELAREFGTLPPRLESCLRSIGIWPLCVRWGEERRPAALLVVHSSQPLLFSDRPWVADVIEFLRDLLESAVEVGRRIAEAHIGEGDRAGDQPSNAPQAANAESD